MIAFLAGILEKILVFFYNFTGSYGVAIILLTLAIRFVLAPLTLSQTRSMAKMKDLQPKMQELQKKYKSQPEEYQKKIMELYKESGYNPLGGCLPLLVQLPFLWALFQVLREFNFGAGFLWLKSLSAPDPYFILPILSAATTYFQTITGGAADTSQKTMLMIMPVFIGFISLQFPAGLVLYWVVSNVFSIGQQYLINMQMSARKPEGGSA